MAEVLGPRKRGRRKEQLRITAAELAGKVRNVKGVASVTVELVPAEGKTKAETVTLEIPKGAAVIPFALTSVKDDANAREQIRLGAKDAEANVSLASVNLRLDSGEEKPLFYITAK